MAGNAKYVTTPAARKEMNAYADQILTQIKWLKANVTDWSKFVLKSGGDSATADFPTFILNTLEELGRLGCWAQAADRQRPYGNLDGLKSHFLKNAQLILNMKKWRAEPQKAPWVTGIAKTPWGARPNPDAWTKRINEAPPGLFTVVK